MLQRIENTHQNNPETQPQSESSATGPTHGPESNSGRDVAIKASEYAAYILIAVFGILYFSHKSLAVWFVFIFTTLFDAAIYIFWRHVWRYKTAGKKALVHISSFAIIIVAFIGCLFWSQRTLPETIPELHGLLIPANDRAPYPPCLRGPRNVVIILLGNSAFLTDKKMTAVHIHNLDLISFAKSDAGVSVSTRVISSDNKVVAQITNNEFYVNPNNYFKMYRPDWHTLIVKEPGGREVLNVYYMNPSAMKILGSFYNPGSSPAIIEENQQVIGGVTYSNACLGFDDNGIWSF